MKFDQLSVCVLALLILCQAAARAQSLDDEPQPDTIGAQTSPPDKLTSQQRQVNKRFQDLEEKLLKLAEFYGKTDPRRAALLRKALTQSKDRDIDGQLSKLADLLQKDRLTDAVKNQNEVQGDMARLLELLMSEDRGKRIENEKERIRNYLKRINGIIKEQKGIQADTEGHGDPKQAAGDQDKLAKKTAELAKDVEQTEGKNPGKPPAGGKPGKPGDKPAPGDKPEKTDKPSKGDKPAEPESGEPSKGKPGDKNGEAQPGEKSEPGEPGDESQGKPQKGKPQPGQPENGKPPEGEPGDADDPAEDQPPAEQENPAQKLIKDAEQKMKAAQKQLEEAQRKGAAEQQEQARQKLEQAKAQLEEILRQLREEEKGRTLALLEGRFRKMLEMQIEVYEGTKRVDKVSAAERDEDDAIESGRLSRKEAAIVVEADKAMTVLEEDGSAAALPEAVADMRDDMEQIVVRLAQAKVDAITQNHEEDVIAALEEMIAALQKAQKDLQNQKSKQGGGGGQMGEPPLVDRLAEIKVIRALQMRVNKRTRHYGAQIQDEQADKPELLQSLRQLADRQGRIHKVTRDIVVGRNQ